MNPPKPALELLSLHVPKCAGSSLGVALERVYGPRLLKDYGDHPGDPAAPMNLDPDGFLRRFEAKLPTLLCDKVAVHGHFHPLKYRAVQARFRTAIIREPVARLVSHYYYWKFSPREGHCLHDYFLEENLALEDFARLPFIRFFYTRVFFAGLSLEDFDFIGCLETMPRALATLERATGHALSLGTEKKSDRPEYRQALQLVANDSALRGRIADLLADDLCFYERVRARWD